MAKIITGDIKEVQQMLTDLGYDTGGVDGKVGAKTAQAIEDYQKSKGGDLTVDGVVGNNTYNSLLNDTSGTVDTSSYLVGTTGPGGSITSNDNYTGVVTGPGGSALEAGETYGPGGTYEWDGYGFINENGEYASGPGAVVGYGPDGYNSTSSTGKSTSRSAFTTSGETDDWQYLMNYLNDNGPGYYTESTSVSDLRKALEDTIASKPADYAESEEVKKAKEALANVEASRPADYVSKYDSTISELLDAIKNRGAFDINTDTNYQTLYDNYKNTYQANASRAMRDAMGSAQGATGGYGSTYSQMVGQQAYDQTMQGMNDNNINLMNLAYSMYSDDRANDYNKLSAYQNQDNIDYSRYRDTVSDWKDDRSYYRNVADNASATDYARWQNDMANWQADRAYYDNAVNNERNFDYGKYQDRVDQYNADRSFYGDMYNQSYNRDLTRYQYDTEYDTEQNDTLYDRALAFASQGIEVPSSYYNSLTDDEIAAINNIAGQQKLTGNTGGGNSGDNGNDNDKTAYNRYEASFAESWSKSEIANNPKSNWAASYNLQNAYRNGTITLEEMDKIAEKYGVDAKAAELYEQNMVMNQKL